MSVSFGVVLAEHVCVSVFCVLCLLSMFVSVSFGLVLAEHVCVSVFGLVLAEHVCVSVFWCCAC